MVRISENFQSGFKAFHSTESALLRVFNDILLTIDSDAAVLMLLDLSATFDKVDHATLICPLEHCVSIRGAALEWFKSYLSERSFLLRLGNSQSSHSPCLVEFPKAQFLGPSSFLFFFYPLD